MIYRQHHYRYSLYWSKENSGIPIIMKEWMSKIQTFGEELKHQTSQSCRKIDARTPPWISRDIVLFFLIFISLLTTDLILIVGLTMAPTDFFSSVVNWHSPKKGGLLIGTLSMLLLLLDKWGKGHPLFVFRDFMVRIYTIFSYGVFLIVLLLIWSDIVNFVKTNMYLRNLGPLWIGLSMLGMIGMYVIRTLPWIRTIKRKTKSWAKAHTLPPYRNQEWHLQPPIETKANKYTKGYTRPLIHEQEPRSLGPAIRRAIITTIIVPIYLVGIEIATETYPDALPDKKAIENSGMTLPFEWASSFVIPSSVISSTLDYFGMSQSQALLIFVVFLIPFSSIAVSSWNVSYIWEESQYRIIRWGINKCGFSQDSLISQLLLLFAFNLFVVSYLFVFLFIAFSYKNYSILILISTIGAGYWIVRWGKTRIEQTNPQYSYWIIGVLTLLHLLLWLALLSMA